PAGRARAWFVSGGAARHHMGHPRPPTPRRLRPPHLGQQLIPGQPSIPYLRAQGCLYLSPEHVFSRRGSRTRLCEGRFNHLPPALAVGRVVDGFRGRAGVQVEDGWFLPCKEDSPAALVSPARATPVSEGGRTLPRSARFPRGLSGSVAKECSRYTTGGSSGKSRMANTPVLPIGR